VRLLRKGFTLTEMMIVVVIVGGLTLFALPRFTGLHERSRLASARQEIEAAIATARAAAIQKGRTSQVHMGGNKVWVTVTSSETGTQTTVIPAIPLDSVYGVTMSAPYTSITFDVRGFASPRLPGGGVFQLVGPTRRDSVCVTSSGQLMPRGCAL